MRYSTPFDSLIEEFQFRDMPNIELADKNRQGYPLIVSIKKPCQMTGN